MAYVGFNVTDRMIMTVKAYEDMKKKKRKTSGYKENDIEIKKWTSNCFRILGEEINLQKDPKYGGTTHSKTPCFTQFKFIRDVLNGQRKNVFMRRGNSDNGYVLMQHTMIEGKNTTRNSFSDLPIKGSKEPCWDMTKAMKELNEDVSDEYIPNDYCMKSEFEEDKQLSIAQGFEEHQANRHRIISDLNNGQSGILEKKLGEAEAKGIDRCRVDGKWYKHKLYQVDEKVYSNWSEE